MLICRVYSCLIRYLRKPFASIERKCFSKHLGLLEEVFLLVMLRHSLIKSVVSMQLGCLCVYGNGRFDNGYVIQNVNTISSKRLVGRNEFVKLVGIVSMQIKIFRRIAE